MEAYRVLRPKEEAGGLRGLEGLDSPLIGRDQEMNQLRARVADLQVGSGQVVSVMGEAGLGKSRLLSELHSALVAEGVVTISNAGSNVGSNVGSMVSPDGNTQAPVAWLDGFHRAQIPGQAPCAYRGRLRRAVKQRHR